MRRKFLLSLVTMIFIVLTAAQVMALGISPGRTLVEFSPGLEQTVEVTVINTEAKAMDVILYSEGELAPYIALSQERLTFSPQEREKRVVYTVKLPVSLGEPGIHGVRIIARELPQTERTEEIVVTALVAVGTTFDVRVPYPGKFIQSHFFIPATAEQAPVRFLLQARNLGTEDIKNAQAIISIFNLDNEAVAVVSSDIHALAAGRSSDIIAQWDANVSYGQYLAQAFITYDGLQTPSLEQRFQVGTFRLQPLAISVNNFNLGDVAKFNILVKNTADQPIAEAVARILLYTAQGSTLADFASIGASIPSLATKELIAYWDTEQVQEGTYEGKLILTADAGVAEHRLRTTVTEDAITTEIIDITGKAIALQALSAAALKKSTTIVMVTLVIVLANVIGWYAYIRRKRGGKTMDNF